MARDRASHRSRVRPSWGAVALVGLLAASAATGVAVAGVWNPTPIALADPTAGAGTVPVLMGGFDDDRTVELLPAVGQAPKVKATASGLMTSTVCAPGQVLRSGQRVAQINNTSVVVLATAKPLWRPIKSGVTGEDVRSINAELRRLKRAQVTGPRATSATVSALAALARLPKRTREVPAGSIAWIPRTRVTVDSCSVVIGDSVAAGDALMVLAGVPPLVSLKASPTRPVDGARVLVIDDLTVPMPAGGLTRARDLEAVAATASYRLWVSSKGAVPLVGHWRLAKARQVATLPASVVVAQGEATCVLAPGGPVAVTVVSSSLGRSLVAFAQAPPSEIQVAPGAEATCG